MNSMVKVAGKNSFDYGFAMGDGKAQETLRRVALDVTMVILQGREKQAALEQFANLPHSKLHEGSLTYYGDMAKFVARHLVLIIPKETHRE